MKRHALHHMPRHKRAGGWPKTKVLQTITGFSANIWFWSLWWWCVSSAWWGLWRWDWRSQVHFGWLQTWFLQALLSHLQAAPAIIATSGTWQRVWRQFAKLTVLDTGSMLLEILSQEQLTQSRWPRNASSLRLSVRLAPQAAVFRLRHVQHTLVLLVARSKAGSAWFGKTSVAEGHWTS